MGLLAVSWMVLVVGDLITPKPTGIARWDGNSRFNQRRASPAAKWPGR
jgi:hypothetical protein